MNDELLEGQHEKELEMAEHVELSRGQTRELLRQLEANKETVADYELTISKFREVVTQLQNQNTQLSQALADARRTSSAANLLAMTPDHSAAVSALMASGVGAGKQPEAQTIAKVTTLHIPSCKFAVFILVILCQHRHVCVCWVSNPPPTLSTSSSLKQYRCVVFGAQ